MRVSVAPVLLCVLGVGLVWQPCLAFDVEGGRPAARPGSPQQPPRTALATAQPTTVAGVKKTVTKWALRYQAFVRAATTFSRLINLACGLWLVIGAPFSVIGSAIVLRADETVLCLYLGFFGALLAGVELPVPGVRKMLERSFFFLYTRGGRTAFLVLVMAIAWSCKHVSFITKGFVGFNALLAFYVYNSPVHSKQFDAYDNAMKGSLSDAASDIRGAAGDMFSIGKTLGIGRVLGNVAKPKDEPPSSFSPPEAPASPWGGTSWPSDDK